MLHGLARVLARPFTLLVLELVLALVVVGMFFSNCVDRFCAFALCAIHALHATLAKATLVNLHDAVELFVVDLVAFVFDALL